MNSLLQEIRKCEVCRPELAHAPRPILSATSQSKVLIIGQAPGSKVHASGVPWADPSGDLLRQWLTVDWEEFYDAEKFAIVPMGFCYPGKGKSGDLPPRPECAPLWHSQLMAKMIDVNLILLIGRYAQQYYLGANAQKNLTETVKSFAEYLPLYFPLPHPSPRNRFWFKKNPWFQKDLLPHLKERVDRALNHSV